MNTPLAKKSGLRRPDERVHSTTVKIPVSPLTKAWLIREFGNEPIKCVEPILQNVMDLAVERIPATRGVNVAEKLRIVYVTFEKPAQYQNFPVLKRHHHSIGRLLDSIANLAHQKFCLGAALFTKPGTAASTYMAFNNFDEVHSENVQKISSRTYKKFVTKEKVNQVDQKLEEIA